MKKLGRFAAALLATGVVFCISDAKAAWVSQGPSGVDSRMISDGKTDMLMDSGSNLWIKGGESWRNSGIADVKVMFSDDYYGESFVGTPVSLHEEVDGSLYDARMCIARALSGCTEWYMGSAISGVVRYVGSDSHVYVISDNHLYATKYGNGGNWLWSRRTPWNIAVPLLVGATSDNRLVVADANNIYLEDSVGSDTFQQIGALSAYPKKLVTFGNDVYILNSLGDVDKFYLYGSSWQRISIGSVRDITADSFRVYLLFSNGIYKTYDGISMTAMEYLSIYANVLAAKDNSLYAGTINGVYSLNLAPEIPVASASVSGSNILVSWVAVSGASGYRVYYGSTTTSYAYINVGNVTSVSIPLAGINVVWVRAYNVDGYESKFTYKWICNSADTATPSSITDLSVMPLGGTSVLVEWTEPADNYGVASFDLRRATAAITSRNWNSSVVVSGMPTPSGSGSKKKITVSGLSPNTTYYFAVTAKDGCGRQSVLYNSKSVKTLSAGMKNISFYWGASADATAYEVCCGASSGNYTSCTFMGAVNQGSVQVADDESPRYCVTRATNNWGEKYSNEVVPK